MSTQKNTTSAKIGLKAKIQKLINNPDSKVKAFASVTIGDEYAIHGIKVIDSDKGLFVSMPSEKWTDAEGNTKYNDTFRATTAASRTNLIDTVMDAYEQALSEVQEQDEDSGEMTMQ